MMKICFVNPTSEKRNWGSAFPPLGLAYLATQAERLGHRVCIIDRDRIMSKHGKKYVDLMTQDVWDYFMKPDIVAITATTPLIPDAYHVARMVKKLLPNCKIILGGPHATALPKQTLMECSEIDSVVVGEGEGAIKRQLRPSVDYLQRKGQSILFRIESENIDNLGFPARHLLDMEHYTQKSKYLIRGVSLRGTSIFTTRGCPYNCAFCTGKMVFGNKVRFHSVDHVIAEIEHIIEKYPQVEGLYFADDMFSANPKRAIAICDELIRREISNKLVFAVQLTAKAGQKRELLLKLKEAGCIQVEYGFESGSQKMLNLMRKHSTVEDNYKAVKTAKNVGMRFLANMIVGMPAETKEDFMASIKFLQDAKPDVIGFYKLILLPGSELWARYAPIQRLKPWDSYLQDDESENLTYMSDNEFFGLYHKWSKWASKYNAIRYLNYNLRRDFWGTAKETIRLCKKKLLKN